MSSEMKMEEFEALLANFGSDVSVWPENRRAAAEAYAETSDGRKMLFAEAALAKLLAAGQAVGPEKASDGNSDAFLGRLMEVPSSYPQLATQYKSSRTTVWLETLADLILSWRSPVGIASQLGGVAAILGVGILVGINSAPNRIDASGDLYATVDISETLFVSGAELLSFDEQYLTVRKN